jgi:diguanylate cyclase (GGDEF)-like protein
MTYLLDTVAELTHLRNKDDLEVRFAQVIFGLAKASRLSLWRVISEGPSIRLRERVSLPLQSAPVSDIPVQDTLPEWRECLASRRHVWNQLDASGQTRHAFPICSDVELTGLMEIIRPAPMEIIEEHLVAGLLRVYRNHLGLLEYGDRDELTGLLNRRTFDAFFKQVSAAHGDHAVVGLIDIDHFKRVNDQFGHPYGDEVLILMARLICHCFADKDGLFRFGGEEFLVILTETTLEKAWAALENFRKAVELSVFPQIGRITVSIGLSLIMPGDTGAAAFGRADEALYVAKQRGRNQTQCHERLVAEGSLAASKQLGGEIELF